MLAKELPRKNLKNTTIKKRNSSNSSKRKELSCRQRRWSSSWLVHGKSGIIERACSRNPSKSKLYAIPSGNIQYPLNKLEFPKTLTLRMNILMQYPIPTSEPGAARNINTQNINQHLRSLSRRRTTAFAFELFDEDNGVFVFVVQWVVLEKFEYLMDSTEESIWIFVFFLIWR